MSIYSTFGSIRRPSLPQQEEGEAAVVATISTSLRACVGGVVRPAFLPQSEDTALTEENSVKGQQF